MVNCLIWDSAQLFWKSLVKVQMALDLFYSNIPGAYLAVLPYGHARRLRGGGGRWVLVLVGVADQPTQPSIKASNTHYAITAPIYSCPPRNEV